MNRREFLTAAFRKKTDTDSEQPSSVPDHGDVIPSGRIFQRQTRREFLSNARDLGFAGLILPKIPGWLRFGNKLKDVNTTAEIIIPEGLEKIAQNIEALLKNRRVSMSLQKIDNSGNVVWEYGHDKDAIFPIASAFKAWVVLYYFWHMPPEDWQMGRGSDVFNVAVYSHNRTTGEIINQVYEQRLMQDPSLREQNALQVFNDFLTQTLGMQHGLYSWGFDGPTQGMEDNRFGPNDIAIRSRQANVSNVSTAADLAKGYQFLAQAEQNPYWQEKHAAFEATFHLLSTFDPAFLSHSESTFLGLPSMGKDGYLPSGTIENLGTVITDGSLTRVEDGWIISTYLSSEEVGVTEQVFDQLSEITDGIPDRKNLSDANPLNPDEETTRMIHTASIYEYTLDERIDRTGSVEVNYPPFLEDDAYQAFLTVNLFDGTVTMYAKEQGRLVEKKQTLSLVGQRLAAYKELQERFSRSSYASRGEYLADRGVYVEEPFGRQPNQILRHTLTPALVADLHSFTATNGFGGLPVPTRHAVLQALSQDGPSETYSQYTFHEIPPMESEHYDNRRLNLSKAIDFNRQGLTPKFPKYWSHGCVNLLRDDYLEIQDVLRPILNQGGKVGVIFSYPGYDQSSLIREEKFDGFDDPLYGDNLSDWAGSQFFTGGF